MDSTSTTGIYRLHGCSVSIQNTDIAVITSQLAQEKFTRLVRDIAVSRGPHIKVSESLLNLCRIRTTGGSQGEIKICQISLGSQSLKSFLKQIIVELPHVIFT
jgi:hypothetical protein